MRFLQQLAIQSGQESYSSHVEEFARQLHAEHSSGGAEELPHELDEMCLEEEEHDEDDGHEGDEGEEAEAAGEGGSR